MKTDAQLVIQSEITGRQFRATKYAVDSDYLLATDAWSANVTQKTDPAGLRRELQPWTPVRLFIDENEQVIGRIDDTEGEGGGRNGLVVNGRDYIADLADPEISPACKITAEMTLEKAILEVFGPRGITKISGNYDARRNVLSGASTKTTVDRSFEAIRVGDLKAQDNEGLFQFVNKFVARHGYTIQPGLSRNEICVVYPQLDQDPLVPLVAGRNVLAGKAKRDWGKVPTMLSGVGRPGTKEVADGPKDTFKFSGRTSFFTGFGQNERLEIEREKPAETSTFNGRKSMLDTGLEIKTKVEKPSTHQIATSTALELLLSKTPIGLSDEVQRIFANVQKERLKKGEVLDPLKVYRPIYHKDKRASSVEQLGRAMMRLLAEQLRGTLTWTTEAKGHHIPGTKQLFAVDTLFPCVDSVEDVDEVLWLGKRKFVYAGSGGAKTALTFYRPGAVVI